jgi:hypothetical protein
MRSSKLLDDPCSSDKFRDFECRKLNKQAKVSSALEINSTDRYLDNDVSFATYDAVVMVEIERVGPAQSLPGRTYQRSISSQEMAVVSVTYIGVFVIKYAQFSSEASLETNWSSCHPYVWQAKAGNEQPRLFLKNSMPEQRDSR